MIRFITLIFLALVLASCNYDFQGGPEVSHSVQESKERKVFLAAYTVGNIKCYDKNYKFPFDEIWLEKSSYEVLDSNNNIAHIIEDSADYLLMFSCEKNKLLNMDTYVDQKWEVIDTIGDGAGFINDEIYMSGNNWHGNKIPDSLYLSIYLTKPYTIKRDTITRLFSFMIYKKK